MEPDDLLDIAFENVEKGYAAFGRMLDRKGFRCVIKEGKLFLQDNNNLLHPYGRFLNTVTCKGKLEASPNTTQQTTAEDNHIEVIEADKEDNQMSKEDEEYYDDENYEFDDEDDEYYDDDDDETDSMDEYDSECDEEFKHECDNESEYQAVYDDLGRGKLSEPRNHIEQICGKPIIVTEQFSDAWKKLSDKASIESLVSQLDELEEAEQETRIARSFIWEELRDQLY